VAQAATGKIHVANAKAAEFPTGATHLVLAKARPAAPALPGRAVAVVSADLVPASDEQKHWSLAGALARMRWRVVGLSLLPARSLPRERSIDRCAARWAPLGSL
jgi:hypothetical protein